MENIREIIAIVSAVVGILITITSFLIPLVKNAKAKKQLIATNQMANVLQQMVVAAEKFTNYSGEEKKQYVMTLANRYAIENNLMFDESYVSSKIEELVALSKQVNAKAQKSEVSSQSIVDQELQDSEESDKTNQNLLSLKL